MKVIIVCEQPLFRLGLSDLINKISPEITILEISNLRDIEGACFTKEHLLICCGHAASANQIADLILNNLIPAEQIILFSAFFGQRHRFLVNLGINVILPMSVSCSAASGYLQTKIQKTNVTVWPKIVADPIIMAKFLPDRNDFTPAEHNVLINLSKGLSNKAIADNLNIKVKTVKVHLAKVCRKMRVQNRTAAATCYGSVLSIH